MSRFVFFLLVILAKTFVLAVEEATAGSACLFKECKCTKNLDESFDILCIANNSDSLFPVRIDYTGYNKSVVINTFLIKRYKFKQIPDNAFRDLEIRNLIIGENNMERLTVKAFRGIKSLVLLRVIEKNLEVIEPQAFKWIRASLSELGLWQLNFMSPHIDAFFEQLTTLNNLKTLNLMGYNLVEFKKEWTRVFSNISSLSLASNDLKTLPVGLFNNASQLISLDLSNNFLTNLTNVFQALKPIQSRLKDLKLYGNSIESLLDFPSFESLEALDLSNNKIKVVYESSFYNLEKLSNLFLSNNLINSVRDKSFYNLKNLVILLLNNNYLSQVPKITTQSRLKILDLSNQNGNLKQIGDFAFERKPTIINPMSVNLDLNEIEKLSNRAFCNRYSNTSEINNLDLAYGTARRIEKCILKQLTSHISSRVSLNVGLYMQSYNQSADLCHCDFKTFVSNNKIDLIGGCSLLAQDCDPTKVSKAFGDEACLNKEQFECILG